MRICENLRFKKLPDKIISLHIVSWLFYIIFELATLKFFYGKLDTAPTYIYAYAVNITWFYTILWALKAPVNRPNYQIIIYLLRWLNIIAIYLSLKFIAAYFFYDAVSLHRQLQRPITFFITNLYRGSIFAFLAIFYYIAGHVAEYKQKALKSENEQLSILKEKAELETKLIKSQNAYLQQQLNPHFLFNALSFVYSQVFKHSNHAAKAIQLLSEILRYSLDQGTEEEKILLNQEINQIENLVEINRYRYDTPLSLIIDVHGPFEKFHFIPLILLTLTENIFKHGNLRNSDNPALLIIKIDDVGNLLYHSRNLKKAHSGHQRLSSIGLKNIRIRLDHTYPGKYQLAIQESINHFDLQLKLAL